MCHLKSLIMSQWCPDYLTMDNIELNKLLVDEVRLKHWDCTIMFDITSLEGQHNIIHYIKPNTLAKDTQTVMECTTQGYCKQCMKRFPKVYSGEMMWDDVGYFEELYLQGSRRTGLLNTCYRGR
jgi:hypothetical protein